MFVVGPEITTKRSQNYFVFSFRDPIFGDIRSMAKFVGPKKLGEVGLGKRIKRLGDQYLIAIARDNPSQMQISRKKYQELIYSRDW